MMNVFRRSTGRIPCLFLLCGLFSVTPVLAGVLVPVAAAQDRGPVQRTVQGKVQNKDGSAVKGAVVYLRDTRAGTVKSFIAGDDGAYRFVQLTQNTDYELWAKLDGKKGKTKTISSFDTRNDLVINLNVE